MPHPTSGSPRTAAESNRHWPCPRQLILPAYGPAGPTARRCDKCPAATDSLVQVARSSPQAQPRRCDSWMGTGPDPLNPKYKAGADPARADPC